jgi:hypothetical protein
VRACRVGVPGAGVLFWGVRRRIGSNDSTDLQHLDEGRATSIRGAAVPEGIEAPAAVPGAAPSGARNCIGGRVMGRLLFC